MWPNIMKRVPSHPLILCGFTKKNDFPVSELVLFKHISFGHKKPKNFGTTCQKFSIVVVTIIL